MSLTNMGAAPMIVQVKPLFGDGKIAEPLHLEPKQSADRELHNPNGRVEKAWISEGRLVVDSREASRKTAEGSTEDEFASMSEDDLRAWLTEAGEKPRTRISRATLEERARDLKAEKAAE